MKPTLYCSIVLMLLITLSCEQIIEPPNIKNKIIELHAPAENASISSERVTFSWEKDNSMKQYRIQVSTPHFDVPHSIVLDSLIWENIYTDSLPTKKDYAWRVRGENSLYHTEFYSRKFSVGLPTLSDQTLMLLAPGKDAILDNRSINFTWNPIQGAENYHLQVATPSFSNGGSVLLDTLTSNSSYKSEVLPYNKNFQWRVSASNYRSKTSYTLSDFRIKGGVDISTILPNLIAPVSDLVIQKEKTNFTWSSISGAHKYHFQLASPDFDQTGQIIIDSLLEGTHFSDSLTINKFYEWRIRGENNAFSSLYASRKFRLTEGEDISTKTVVLLAPYNGATLNLEHLNLTWESLDGADYYHLQLASPSFSSPVQIWVDTLTTKTSLDVNVKSNTKYQWRVSAKNSSFSTPYSNHVFTIP